MAITCAELCRSYDQPTMAANLIIELGYTLKDLEIAGVDEYDLKELRDELNDIQIRRNIKESTP
jgi:hypothetical protein